MRQSARDVGLILSFFLFLLLLFLFLLLLPVIMYLPVNFPIVLHPLPQKGYRNSNLPKNNPMILITCLESEALACRWYPLKATSIAIIIVIVILSHGMEP